MVEPVASGHVTDADTWLRWTRALHSIAQEGLTYAPGVYLSGRGGVRIEDTLVVRTAGPETLITTTRELLVL